MADLLEFLLEALLSGVDVLERWRFSLCVLAGVIVAIVFRAKVDHKAVSTVLTVLTSIAALGTGIIWEIRSH